MVIDIEENHPKIVVTDGYHFTRPLEVVFHHIHTYCFTITCAVENLQLVSGGMIFVLLYLAGFASGIFLLKLLSFLPVLFLVLQYFLNRNSFIRIRTTPES